MQNKFWFTLGERVLLGIGRGSSVIVIAKADNAGSLFRTILWPRLRSKCQKLRYACLACCAPSMSLLT